MDPSSTASPQEIPGEVAHVGIGIGCNHLGRNAQHSEYLEHMPIRNGIAHSRE
jgi:hypothetical protein